MTLNRNKKYGLKQVVNASGKMTILGVSKVSESVKKAQHEAGSHFYEMSDLIQKTGDYIAKRLQVEAAVIVSSASAGIAQSVAGLIGKGDLYHLYHPYEQREEAREIILPKGHNVDYGTPVELMIAQGGGQLVEAGYSNICTPEHIKMMITSKTAGIVYIKSHHTVQKSMLTVTEAAKIAHQYHLPLIVDAAAEEDLFTYYRQGADLVIYSGAKSLEGPSSGLVIGKKKYVDWVRLQSQGMGRSMKIGKENILGLTQAIEDYLDVGVESGEAMKERLLPFITTLNQLSNVTATMVQDSAGRDIYRAETQISGEKSAKQVIAELKEKNPAIYTREYRANQGIIEFDVRAVTKEEMQQIIESLQEILEK